MPVSIVCTNVEYTYSPHNLYANHIQTYIVIDTGAVYARINLPILILLILYIVYVKV